MPLIRSRSLVCAFAVLLLAACQPPAGSTPPVTPPLAGSPNPARTPTSTVQPTPTLDPVTLFQEWSRGWQVAYQDYETGQMCASYGDGSNRICTAYGSLYPDGTDEGSWSPDGNRMVLENNTGGLYIWDLGGGFTPFLVSQDFFVQEPDWSPDGDMLAFASSEMRRHVGQTYGLDIYISGLDGGNRRNLTGGLPERSDSHFPDWSPDGERIVFESRATKPNPDYPADPWPYRLTDTEIYTVALDGSGLLRLTDDEAEDRLPKWSPDGERVAFLSDRDGSFDLYIMNADGSAARQAAALGLESLAYTDIFTWLPDGRLILFGEMLIDTETGGSTRISFELPYASVKSWLMGAGTGALALLPTPNCASGWTRLRSGVFALVMGSPDDPPNRVRSGPGTADEVIYQIYPGMVARVLAGPVCADGLVFWQVGNDFIPGGSGWTAEGDGVEYWLEPIEP